MDGNGRWAKRHGWARIKGHERGTTAVREVTEECAQLGVEALTLYAFSEENWQRPALEIKMLMALLERFLVKERKTMMDNNVRLLHAGRIEKLPASVRRTLQESMDMTAGNTGMDLCLAISYGGRAELRDAMVALAQKVKNGELSPEDISEELISAHLYQPKLPHPDLLIRTANERRISNFLLWQVSYSEIHISEVEWPDFRRQHLWQAFEDFGQRTRKYGSVIP